MKPRCLWIVTPVYEDVEAFLRLRSMARDVLTQTRLRTDVRFVVVDDTGGLDREIDRLHPLDDVLVIDTPFNLGHQRALVFGLRKTLPHVDDTDIILTMDSDGEDAPEDIPRLLEPLQEDISDLRRVAVAHRTGRKTSLTFKVMYVLFRLLFRALTSTSVRSGNFAAYRGWMARRMLVHPNFDFCYSAALLGLNLPIRYVPCERRQRYAGRSRMNYLRLLIHGLRMLMPFADRIAVRALVLFSATLTVGVALGLLVISIKLFTDAAIPGWATSTALGIVILSFVSLGNFVVLFTSFSQSRGISLANLEQVDYVQTRIPSR